MRCYGYIKNTDAEMPLDLEEVTIEAKSEVLRSMAQFLLHVANEMDVHGDKFGHEHFEGFCSNADLACRLIVTQPHPKGTPSVTS